MKKLSMAVIVLSILMVAATAGVGLSFLANVSAETTFTGQFTDPIDGVLQGRVNMTVNPTLYVHLPYQLRYEFTLSFPVEANVTIRGVYLYVRGRGLPHNDVIIGYGHVWYSTPLTATNTKTITVEGEMAIICDFASADAYHELVITGGYSYPLHHYGGTFAKAEEVGRITVLPSWLTPPPWILSTAIFLTAGGVIVYWAERKK